MHDLLTENVRSVIEEVFGDRGREWIRDLPQLLEQVCRLWNINVTGDAFEGGTHSYVAPVQRADGTVAILKLPVVDDENVAEATALYHYAGDGAVRLFEFDYESGAMLLEYAAPGTPLVWQGSDGPPHLEGRPENAEKVAHACAIYRRLWRVPVGGSPYPALPRVSDLLARWAEDFPRRMSKLGTAIPQELVERFDALCREFSIADGAEGIVNRDTHLGNIVAAEREAWLLIDPKPLLGERAFDAGYLVQIQVESLPDKSTVDEMVARVARGLGVSCQRARGWGFMRAMEETLGRVEDGDPQAERFLATAKLLS